MGVKLLLLGSPFGLLFLALCFRYWEKTILAIPFWLLLEGAARKWLFPEYHIEIYFVKDVILAAAFLHFVMLRLTGKLKRHTTLKVYDFFFLLLIIWCVLELFNPAVPNFWVSVMGMKIHLFYALLLYAMPYIFKTKQEVVNYLRLYVFCSLPLLIVGIIQFFSPPGSFITRSLSWGETIEYTSFGGSGLFGDRVRITSTFAYLTEYSGYLTVLSMILLPLIQVRHLKGRSLLYPLSALAGVNLMMTGSRAPILFISLGSMFFFFLSGVISI